MKFKENMSDTMADMIFVPADQKVTKKIIKERNLELQQMYRRILRIANFTLFKVFEMIVSDILDLNNACIEGREQAESGNYPDPCLAISIISYAGEDLFFHKFWYSFHSSRKAVTKEMVEDFFYEEAKLFPKKVFKTRKTEESYQYVDLLKLIDFDLRQNVVL